MTSIYIDTTKYIALGLLDSEQKWLSYSLLKDSKASAVIHYLIDKMLKENGLDISDVKNFIYAAGPGSYTGMRVSEGLAQMFDFSKIKISSFYHFEVPKILGRESGLWASDAFKNEVFIYSWNGKEVFTELIKKEKFSKEEYFSSYDVEKSFETSSLIFENSVSFFNKILNEKRKRNIFYYRSLEDEFTAGIK